MITSIHHLNCGTIHPWPAQLVAGKGGFFKRATMVCHCLLLETSRGLMLVDAGFSRDDINHPVKRLGSFFYNLTRPSLVKAECAVEQIARLGLNPDDVSDIFISHCELDHIGGLSDFPKASVHVLKAELDALQHRTSFKEKWAYRDSQIAHNPHWVTHECQTKWFGFDALQPFKNEPDILMVSLPGHSRGHAGVAVKQGSKWLLHVGDAYFHPDQLKEQPQMPFGLKVFQDMLVTANKKVHGDTLRKLRTLAREHPHDVEIFNAHNYDDFLRYGSKTKN